ncbi:MAG TPA: hypothetical protein VK611_20385 [Acidimicrobiales bacterium]|nr:hypothetical protein [Acidimicrobiales bacterium]
MGVSADGWQAASLEQFLGHGPDGNEEIELIGGAQGEGLVFGCRHMPAAGGATSGVVICPPVLGDAAVNYQREARLGRWLARAGVACQRFHYRGTGDSDRVDGGMSFASLVADARRATDELRERCGIERIGFLGTRIGALVAARVAADFDGAPLAVWQPVVDPRRFVEDSVRVDSGRHGLAAAPPGLGALPVGFEGPPAPAATPAWSLHDVPLGRDLFDPSVIDNLVDAAGRRPRPILLVQLHRRVGLAPEYRAAAGRWQARGFSVDVAYDPTEDDWWEVHPGWRPSDEVLSATSSWLPARLAPGGNTIWEGST